MLSFWQHHVIASLQNSANKLINILAQPRKKLVTNRLKEIFQTNISKNKVGKFYKDWLSKDISNRMINVQPEFQGQQREKNQLKNLPKGSYRTA